MVSCMPYVVLFAKCGSYPWLPCLLFLYARVGTGERPIRHLHSLPAWPAISHCSRRSPTTNRMAGRLAEQPRRNANWSWSRKSGHGPDAAPLYPTLVTRAAYVIGNVSTARGLADARSRPGSRWGAGRTLSEIERKNFLPKRRIAARPTNQYPDTALCRLVTH